ncbi:FtsX-like permease family protein [Klenkia taihuensis]|uniref:FtsX-like permease family protein n=1 Tax=Klenkia taihuensis TaxID=1225127 RepID=UPI000B8204F7|nr:FtsX-like permease family protein [Klenkia taihuensis]
MPLRGGRAQVLAAPAAWVVALLVVALATALAVVVPAAVAATADDAVRAQAAAAGTGADTVVTAPFPEDPSGTVRREAGAADDTRALAADLAGRLPGPLAGAVGTPVAAAGTRDLPLTLPAPVAVALGPTELRLTWVARAGGAAVTWTAGAAPGVAAADGEVQAGLAAPVAAALGVGPGDRLAARTPDGVDVDVVVSGVFTADDPTDPVWVRTPRLLGPATRGSGAALRTAVAALLSDDALPDARVAAGPLTRTVTFPAAPGGLTAPGADAVARAVTEVRAAPVVLGVSPLPRVDSRLGDLLDAATATLDAARAQAAVLVAAVGLATALVLLLAAAALVGRRGRVLGLSRARGGSLPGLATALLVEGGVLTVAGAGAGLLLGIVLAPGPVPWGAAAAGVLPVALAGVLALPVLGVRAADAATGGRRVPLDARARTRARRETRLRRGAVDLAVVLLAVGAVLALRSRGVPGGLLAVAAPALAVLAGAVLVARVQPALTGALLGPARRSRGAVPLLAAAGARSTAVLAPVALTAVVALAVTVVCLGTTARAGQVEASWTAVGADAAVTADPLPDLDLPDLDLAGAPGVDLAVPARVAEGVQLSTAAGGARTRVVVVDPGAYAELVGSTPLPDVAGLEGLEGLGDRALVTPDVGGDGTVLLDGQAVRFTVAGTLPPGPTTVLLPPAAVPADLAAPDVLWLTGPGAAAAAATVPGGTVELRADRLAAVADAPLPRGLAVLGAVAAGVLLDLGVLAVVLGGVAGARRRRATSGVLRTLGLGERQARAVTLLELLPGVLATAVPGALLGVAVAALVSGPLGLRLLTGQATDPALAVPWWLPVLLVPPLLAVGVTVLAEARARRRVPLGTVLREP